MDRCNFAELFEEGWLVPHEKRPAGPATIALERRVKHGGRELESIEVGVLRGVHARQAPDDWTTLDAVLSMAGLLTGLPDVVLDALSGPDLEALLDETRARLWPILELPGAHANMPEPEPGEERTRLHRRPIPALAAPLVLELVERAQVGAEAVTRLEFRSITGKDCRGLPATLQVRDLPKVVQALTGVSRALFDQLGGVDLQRALGVAQCFFIGTRRSGAASSASSPPGSTGRPAT